MATTPTNKPVPSEDPRDLKFNAGKMDEAVNSTSLSYTDRLGKQRKTWSGIEADTASKLSEIDNIITSLDGDALIKSSVEVGIAETTNGQYFRVPQGPESDKAFIYYRNENSAAVPVNSLIGNNAVSNLRDEINSKIISDDKNSNVHFTLTDSAGFNIAQLGAAFFKSQLFSIQQSESIRGLLIQDKYGFNILPQLSFKGTGDNDIRFVDEYGFWIFSAVKASQAGSQPSDELARGNLILSMNADALARSSAVKDTVINGIQRTVFDYNIVLTYGQSLSTGMEGWPALSKIPLEPENVLMFGDSVRGTTRKTSGWSPLGVATLKPLKAVVQADSNTSATLLTDSEVAALTPGATNEGESLDVGAVNAWRIMQNDFRGVSANPGRKIIVLNCGCPGTTVEELSRGASPNLFNRMVEAVTKLKAYINGVNPSATVGIVSVLYAQGEYNYTGQNGGTGNYDLFLGLTKQLREDINTYVVNAVLGQVKAPAFITYQSGGSFTRDATAMAIGNAQLEMSNTVPGCFLAAPAYPVTDKGGHLDPNGYRWLGMQFGKMMHKVIDRGIDCKPLQPVKAVVLDGEILVSFLVPHPPLKFSPSWQVLTAYLPVNKGFRVIDGSGEVNISSVEIVGSSVVSIKLAREVNGDTEVAYAPQAIYSGNGCLCDSDPTISPFNYEYNAGSGQYPAANIPELVNKPYPLTNFCVAFRISAYEQNN